MIASRYEEELKVNSSKILINLFPYEKRDFLRNILRKGGSHEDEAIQLLSAH